MRTQLPLIFCMGLSLQAYAQDVNNPTASPLDRPQGPPSAPAISVPQAPIASSAPTTTDPNAPVDGRATPFPPSKDARATPAEKAEAAREGVVNGPPRSNGF